MVGRGNNVGQGIRLVVTVTVLVAVLTEVVVLVTVLLDGGWVAVVDGASVVVGVASEAVGDSVTVWVVPPDAGAPGRLR